MNAAATASARAPRIDVTSGAFKRDPFPTLERLRAEGPLVYARVPFLGTCRLVTTYAVVSTVLKDPARFVVDARNAGRGRFDAIRVPIPRSFRRLADNMLGTDDPDHRRLRNLVERAFRRRNVEQMGGRIGALTDGLLDRIAPRLAAGETVDLVPELAKPLPLGVICELLGLPEADRPRFLRWAGNMTSASTPLALLRALGGIRRLNRYLDERFEHARRHGGEGLLAALVAEEEAGDRLSADELASMAFLLLIAGYETTSNLIGGGVLALLREPETARKPLFEGDTAVATAVEELLRFVSPVQMTKPRYVAEDTVLEGQALPRGDVLLPVLAAANADPAAFAEPRRLDLARHPNPHLAFGSGLHSCLGLQLARAEGRAAIGGLFARAPALRLAVPEESLRWTNRLGLRALRALPVRAG